MAKKNTVKPEPKITRTVITGARYFVIGADGESVGNVVTDHELRSKRETKEIAEREGGVTLALDTLIKELREMPLSAFLANSKVVTTETETAE